MVKNNKLEISRKSENIQAFFKLKFKAMFAISCGTFVGTASMTFLLALNRFVTLLEIHFTHCLSEKWFYYVSSGQLRRQ